MSASPTSQESVRVTSATGASKEQKLARFDLIPQRPLSELAKHYGRGAVKYPRVGSADNWRLGYPYSSSAAALQRHFSAWLQGEDNDPELGSNHLVAVAWHAFTLLEFQLTPGFDQMYDDRQDTKVNPIDCTAEDVQQRIRAILDEKASADG